MDKDVEKIMREQADRIFTLRQEVKDLTAQLDEYKKKDAEISSAIVSALALAKEIEQSARLKADLEMERLRAFHKKWTSAYDRVAAMLPDNTEVKSAGEYLARLGNILGESSADRSQFVQSDLEAQARKNADRLRAESPAYVSAPTNDDLAKRSPFAVAELSIQADGQSVSKQRSRRGAAQKQAFEEAFLRAEEAARLARESLSSGFDLFGEQPDDEDGSSGEATMGKALHFNDEPVVASGKKGDAYVSAALNGVEKQNGSNEISEKNDGETDSTADDAGRDGETGNEQTNKKSDASDDDLFSMDEILHPEDEKSLDEICKELGIG